MRAASGSTPIRSVSRRQAILRVAALGGGFVAARSWALRPDHAAPLASASVLQVPGDSGHFGYLSPRGEALKVRVVEQTSKHIALAYRVEHRGKLYLNPTLMVRHGERFRVEMQNDLTAPTIIHWHGLHIDARNDGSGVTVAGPGERFSYDFEVRDREAMYWYHPHPHGLTASQVYGGLFGMLFVDGDDESKLRSALDLVPGRTEIALTLQDRRPGSTYAPTPMEEMHGFVGSTVFVNGREYPHFFTSTRLYRFRILNASNARTYRIAFRTPSDMLLPFMLIGTDGGLLDKPLSGKEVFLSTAERIDVLVDFSSASVGDVVYLCTRAFDPMHNEMNMLHHDAFAEGAKRDLLELRVNRRETYRASVPDRLTSRVLVDTGKAGNRSFRLGFAKGEWRINDMTYKMGETPIEVARNTTETWLIRNYFNSMPHAMHLHGFHFDVIGRETSPDQVAALKIDDAGRLPTDLGSRDTVLVWPGESVRIGIDFTLPADPAFAGDQTYLFHCHNLE